MRICHFSDIHFRLPPGALRLSEMLCAKRLLGGLNYVFRRKKFADDRRKFASFQELLAREAFDTLVFTGDFTSLGLRDELQAARNLFQPLLQGPTPLLFLPGNHDRYARDAGPSAFFEIFSRDLPRWARPLRPGQAYPQAFTQDGVEFLLQCTAVPNGLPGNASGSIPRRELESLTEAIRQAGDRNRFTFILAHHGLTGSGSKAFPFLHGLRQAKELTAVLARTRNTVYLHGHVHRPFVQEVVPRSVYAICAGSLTHQGRESFWAYDLGPHSFEARRGSFDGARYRLDTHPSLVFPIRPAGR